MRHFCSLLIFFFSVSLQAQIKKPFQVLVAENATINGIPAQPLQLVDDASFVKFENGEGFVSLVHEGGTTFELNERVFTLRLKPAALKNRKDRPALEILYEDSTVLDQTKLITVLHPVFDRSGYLEWNASEPIELLWHLHDEPVLNYILSVSDGSGNKIQDFRTRLHQYTLKPATYGLGDGMFSFKIQSTFAGETIESKTYTVKLTPGPTYEIKASDMVLRALDLELSPVLALEVWKTALTMPNGTYYKALFEKFLIRNRSVLTAAGEDVPQLLSQNR